ncbi:MAG: hypothetical protein CVV64_10865 [Candidatus Wallbacteria bacterium HGW-Wallbacteria-1]|jgi:hypothetical protein|uniref:Divergent polysaccharide deacetylase family protein n=1 Tax=Candidatus Wallbacteria bacterium HGW-Wallbacteria-1 TaxID=2013854 RepID=A0A2N1PPG1_9BACT|nr:MAG: hypothetical protein CVV64_10865 [Candidatus Wallbacteria bacterium HGW-Wallbacteria-1]
MTDYTENDDTEIKPEDSGNSDATSGSDSDPVVNIVLPDEAGYGDSPADHFDEDVEEEAFVDRNAEIFAFGAEGESGYFDAGYDEAHQQVNQDTDPEIAKDEVKQDLPQTEDDDFTEKENDVSFTAVIWLALFMTLVAGIWAVSWKLAFKSIDKVNGGISGVGKPLSMEASNDRPEGSAPTEPVNPDLLMGSTIEQVDGTMEIHGLAGETGELAMDPVCDPRYMIDGGVPIRGCTAEEAEACLDLSMQIEYVVDFLLDSLAAGLILDVKTSQPEERHFENLRWKWVRKEVITRDTAQVASRLRTFFSGSSFELLGMNEVPSGNDRPETYTLAAGFMGRAMIEIVVQPPVPAKERKGPLAAIIIDDLGYGGQATRELMELPPVITFSILPWEKYSVATAELARARGFEIMLHQPMEGSSPHIRLGPGGLFTSMNSEEILRRFRNNLGQLGKIVGVNNHMGSVFTANESCMRTFMAEVSRQGLYFVDSRTTVKTVAESQARFQSVPCARRRVFIDNEVSDEPIRVQLRQLMKIARKEGSAIGIGHAHLQTIRTIADMLPEFVREGITLVPAGELVR